MNKRRITLQDISKHINISRTTIYKVLNNKGSVKEKTRKKVLSAIKDLEYQPNKAAKNLALNKEYTIGFVGFHSPRSPHFLKNIQSGIHAAEQELHDYGLRVQQSTSTIEEPETQHHVLLEMCERGFDGIALIPNDIAENRDLELLKKTVDYLSEQGTKVITVNRDLLECKRKWYVGCDYCKSGALAAEILGKMAPPGEILVLLTGNEDELFDTYYRLSGFRDKIGQFESLRILPPYHHYNDQHALYCYLDSRLSDNPNITGLFDLSYELDVISEVVRKHNNRIKVIGFDLCKSIKQHMLEHSVDAIVFQDMFAQGYFAIKSLYTELSEHGKVSQSNIITKLEVVFEENLDFYM